MIGKGLDPEKVLTRAKDILNSNNQQDDFNKIMEGIKSDYWVIYQITRKPIDKSITAYGSIKVLISLNPNLDSPESSKLVEREFLKQNKSKLLQGEEKGTTMGVVNVYPKTKYPEECIRDKVDTANEHRKQVKILTDLLNKPK